MEETEMAAAIRLAAEKLKDQRKAAVRPVLELAFERVEENRRDYGTPRQTFRSIANVLNALGFRANGPLEPEHVAIIMVALKLCRIVHGEPKLDSWVDVAGYAACAGELFDDFSI